MSAFNYRPTVAQVVDALAEAKAYWDAEEVEVFLFGSSVEAAVEGELFGDAPAVGETRFSAHRKAA